MKTKSEIIKLYHQVAKSMKYQLIIDSEIDMFMNHVDVGQQFRIIIYKNGIVVHMSLPYQLDWDIEEITEQFDRHIIPSYFQEVKRIEKHLRGFIPKNESGKYPTSFVLQFVPTYDNL